MDKGHRSLFALLGNKHLRSRATTVQRSRLTTENQCNSIQAAAVNLCPPRGSQLGDDNDKPFFLDLKPYRKKVAVTDVDGDVTYEELFKRSFYLSCEIKKALRNRPNKNQHISLICPNGVSYVIGQWAIWMTGNIVVPLSGQHTNESLENFIGDTDSALVITAPALIDKVEKVAQKTGRPLICQDQKLMAQTNVNIDDVGLFPSPIFNDNLYPKDEPVMMFYLTGDQRKRTRVYLTHKDLNRDVEFVKKFWNLEQNASMLHALSLYNPYGVVASLMSPLSAGGRVVLLPQFDANKVWSHLLGIGDQVPRIDAFAGVPIHYESLLNRYQEIFKSSNHKDFVRDKCSERVKLMANGIKYMDYDVYKEWAKITGHNIKLAY